MKGDPAASRPPLTSLIASCAFGLEAVLARELRDLGMSEVQSDNGQVSFAGDLARANLWCRTADRIWQRMARFPATTFEELFQGVKNIGWGELMPRNACFPVEGLSHNSQLSSVPACQSIVKKAVVESMQVRYKMNRFPEDGPKFPIRVALNKDLASILLDTSGTGLHKRGYRLLTNEAPLRETLAAGMVLLSYWNPERLLIDPMCGSGTILLEAAMIGLNMAPGLKREFASEHWNARLYRQARQEAEERLDKTAKLQIFGYDADGGALRHARQNLDRLGLQDRGIFFETRTLQEFKTRHKYGVMITNPPYGQRMSERKEAEQLYRDFGEVMRPHLDTWSLYVISDNPDFPRFFGAKESKRRKLYNGMIECTYFQYLGPRPPS